MEEKIYKHWLATTDGIGFHYYNKMKELKIDPKQIYEMPEKELINLNKEWKLPPKIITNILKRQKMDIHKLQEELTEKKIKLILPDDSEYPKRLLKIPDPPLTLFYHGSVPKDEELTVAVVGARNCSEYGEYVAKELGKCLAKYQISLISGMARGIDGVGQYEAAKAGGKVYAVLGCGVDVCYPYANKRLYQNLWDDMKHGIISEYNLETQAKAQLFPPRNRIISGLADYIVVIEAGLKSGTLITVDMALEQGKEVYVLPGRITDRLSDGCNKLLKEGAEVFLSPEEFVREIMENKNGILKGREAESVMLGNCLQFEMTEAEKKIYEAIDLEPIGIDEICLKSKIWDVSTVLCCLTNLQLKGGVKQLGMKYLRKM